MLTVTNNLYITVLTNVIISNIIMLLVKTLLILTFVASTKAYIAKTCYYYLLMRL